MVLWDLPCYTRMSSASFLLPFPPLSPSYWSPYPLTICSYICHSNEPDAISATIYLREVLPCATSLLLDAFLKFLLGVYCIFLSSSRALKMTICRTSWDLRKKRRKMFICFDTPLFLESIPPMKMYATTPILFCFIRTIHYSS